MIVCSCNVLTDREVREAAKEAASRSTAHVYGCLGCSAQCGRCARTIRKIIDEALGGAKLGCPVGCACAIHAAHPDHEHTHPVEHPVEPAALRTQKPINVVPISSRRRQPAA
jgi:bacterioferritin-associated ferredoxin